MRAAADSFQPVDDDGHDAQAPSGCQPGADAVAAPKPVSRAGFVDHVDACVRHLADWLGAPGTGPERLRGSEFAAAEHSRVQLWQWLHSGAATLDDGTPIDFALFDAAIQRVGERLPRRGAGQGNVLRAAWLLTELTYARTLADSVSVAAPVRGC